MSGGGVHIAAKIQKSSKMVAFGQLQGVGSAVLKGTKFFWQIEDIFRIVAF